MASILPVVAIYDRSFGNLAIFLFELGRVARGACAEFSYPAICDNNLYKWLFALAVEWIPGLFFNVFTDYLSLFVIRPLLIRSGTIPVIGLALGTVSGAAIVLAAFTAKNSLAFLGLSTVTICR